MKIKSHQELGSIDLLPNISALLDIISAVKYEEEQSIYMKYNIYLSSNRAYGQQPHQD